MGREGQLISTAAVFRRQHEDDVFGIIDLIEKTPGTDSISPCFGVNAFQFFYVGSNIRVRPQLRINELSQHLLDFRLAGQSNLLQVFPELFGFK